MLTTIKRITLCLALGLLYIHPVFSQKKMPADDVILFTAGTEEISVGEFRYVYEKNNLQNDSLYLKPDLDTYLNLYIYFKLKVMEAKAMGMDTIPAFIQEFDSYRKQLSKPYLTETKVTDALVQEAYDRMLYQVDASHILIQITDEADTLEAYQTITELRRRASQGESFESLAKQYSQDPSAIQNGGRLGYFSAFQMVYPFESAAYNTSVNNVSDIIRTRFGYHIIKVHDKRPNPGQVQVAHIYLRPPGDPSAGADIEKKARQIHEKLLAGESWDALCMQFSEDQRTKSQGGVLPFFSTGEMPPAFENIAMKLQQPGEISEPFTTQFGWHIVKLLTKKPVDSFEKLKETLVQQVSRDTRAQQGKKQSISNLKDRHGFSVNNHLKNTFSSKADSTLIEGKWQWIDTAEMGSEWFIQIANQTFTVDDFARFIKKNQRKRVGISPQQYLDNLYERFEEEIILGFEEKMLEETDSDFKYLVQEYKNGLLLFDVMEKMVWGKSMADTTGLREFYENHKNNYQWNTRAEARIFHTSQKDIIDEIEEKMHSGQEIPLFEMKLQQDSFADFDMLADSLDKLKKIIPDLSLRFAGNIPASAPLEYLQVKIDGLGLKNSKIEITQVENTENTLIITGSGKSIKAFEHFYNRRSALTLQVNEGFYEKDVSEWFGNVPWEKGLYRFAENGRYYLVMVDNIYAPGIKRLEEVRGRVISDYQQYLENRWLKELKKKYTVRINKRSVSKMYKKL